MYTLVLFCAVVVACVSATGLPYARNKHHSQTVYGDYNFGYNSEDGQYRTETRDHSGAVVGKYGYIGPDGRPVEVAYSADPVHGFKAVGTHVPVAAVAPVAVKAAAAVVASPAYGYSHLQYGAYPGAYHGGLYAGAYHGAYY